jgi:hypothetical protein
MPVNITSTTDSTQAVTAALGDLATKEAAQPAATETVAKTKEASGASTSAAAEIAAETKEASGTSTETEITKEETEGKENGTERKSNKKGGVEKKIGKLTKQREAARAEAQYWREEALKTQKSAEKPSVVETKTTVDATGKPDKEKFETHEAYVEALADWKVDQKLSTRDQKAKETEVKTGHEAKVKTHVEKVKEFSKKHEDFNDLMESVDDVPMSLTVQQVILESENGPELMYELAKNREDYERICKLPAIQAARELGRFETKIFKASETSKETQTTKAPPPISPVGKGKVVSTKDPGEMPYQEFKKWREAQLKG